MPLITKNARADETTVHGAATSYSTVRTTIPAFISSSMGIKKGDKFRWKIDGDKPVIEVVKADM